MNIPDTALFYIVESDAAIRDLIEALYGHPSLETINHVLRTNPHLQGDWVQAGQMLIVTPPASRNLAMLEQQMTIGARHLDQELKKLTSREREILARHYALLSNLAACQIVRYGWTTTRFDQHKKNLETQMDRLHGMPEPAGVNTVGISEAGLNEEASEDGIRQQLSMQIHQSVCGILSSRLFSQGCKVAALKAEARVLRGADVHQWKTQVGPAKTIASFKTHLNGIIRNTKSFAHLGSLTLDLDCARRGTRQLDLFAGEGSAVPWSVNPSVISDRAHLLIAMGGGHPDLLRCSIHNGGKGEPVFSRCYQKSPSWLKARLAACSA